MSRILVGTCSWTDPTLLQSDFYPKDVNSAEKRLQYYAQNFPIVEVDSSYYALPSEANARLWAQRTPQDFVFDIKAFALFTEHPTQTSRLPKEILSQLPAEVRGKGRVYLKDLPADLADEVWHRFEAALLPLESAGKLGVVLFQFPPWFLPRKASYDHILHCRERLPGYRVAVEFRHNSWLVEERRDRVLRFLGEHNLALVCVDEPQGFKSSMPPLAEATAEMAMIRFHGRNRDVWEAKGITVTERFNYLYERAELEEWALKIKALASGAQEVHVLFNNCNGDKAVRNARDMAALLGSG